MKVLLLDTAFAAAPIYRGLIDAGHDVWVMGNRPNDLLARAAEKRWIDQNYSDPARVRDHIDHLRIDCVIPGCTDVSMETCVKLESSLHYLDPSETSACLSNKSRFRAICEELNLPAPRVVARTSFPREGRYICKPVDSYSGRGITVFDGADLKSVAVAIEEANRASRSGTSLIETYVGNALYSCSGFLKDQRFSEVFFVKEGSSANPYAVDTSFVVDDFPADHREILIRSLERLATLLLLRDGLLHTQFILSDEGPMIVEVSRRCPGDLYPLLIEFSTGYRYGAKYASTLGGYSLDANTTAKRHVLRHTVTADNDSVYSGLSFSGSSVPIVAFFPIALMGEVLLSRQGNRAGILFTEYSSRDALFDAYDSFVARDVYNVVG